MFYEAAHLPLKCEQGGSGRFRAFLERAALDVSFAYVSHAGRVIELMETYADTPMDFADACLVALYETKSDATALTTDDVELPLLHGQSAACGCKSLLV